MVEESMGSWSHPGFEYRGSRTSLLNVDENIGSWSHPKFEYRSSRVSLLVVEKYRELVLSGNRVPQ